jgi:hypothetical protein
MARYLIGIDLGTTNSALAYIDLEKKTGRAAPSIEILAIPQLVALADVGTRLLLPSFLYLPGPHDLPPGSAALPWNPGASDIVGEFARAHGAKVPGRLVTSAKSWLCHAGVDRSAPLLPWTAPPDVPRISPVEASVRYLQHMVDSWNYTHGADMLETQRIVLTVPASFDDVARQLTVEAAHRAGLKDVTLLEEPQAAFYCWLADHSPQEVAALESGARCLVIDVGGGTTDFSLIQAIEQHGDLGFVRQAVGDHLLLGGDNMDLALARLVETRLPAGGRLDAVQFGALSQACRVGKEVLLAPDAPASYTVTVVGRGRQVVGGAQHAAITVADVKQALFEGFFPLVPPDAEPVRAPRLGLHDMGLPYVSDPAISRHLAAFLRRHAPAADPRRAAPDALLFNGGVFQPAAMRDRLMDVLHHWYATAESPWRPLMLTNPSLDLAVATGAAHYAWLRHAGGRRIGGGTARSYYVGVAGTGAGPAAPSLSDHLTVLCVVPKRLEEGHEVVLDKPELELALGQPVAFPLYSSTVRGNDAAGQVLSLRRDQLLQLPPLHSILRGGKRSGTKLVPVTLAARSTEVGTLELWCVARHGGNRWRLEFNVRDVVSDGPETPADDSDGASRPAAPADVWPEVQVQEAGRLIRDGYTAADTPIHPRQLTKLLESALEAPRQDWPIGLCRRLWDILDDMADRRRLSPAHLARWYYLAGYCLRPGFGEALDRVRIEKLWKLFHAPHRAAGTSTGAGRAVEGGADFWIMWRRVSGGLNGQLQSALFDRIRPALLPGKGKAAVRPGANELAEMWRAAASLERLGPKQKEALGDLLLKPLRRSPVPTYGYWSLTRLGARVLFYGPLNATLHPAIAQRWLDAVLPFQPQHDSERMAWAFCLAQLARRSGQRALDVDENFRERVLATLKAAHAPAHWALMVSEVVEADKDEQGQMFGESLPIGLRLAGVANAGN